MSCAASALAYEGATVQAFGGRSSSCSTSSAGNASLDAAMRGGLFRRGLAKQQELACSVSWQGGSLSSFRIFEPRFRQRRFGRVPSSLVRAAVSGAGEKAPPEGWLLRSHLEFLICMLGFLWLLTFVDSVECTVPIGQTPFLLAMSLHLLGRRLLD